MSEKGFALIIGDTNHPENWVVHSFRFLRDYYQLVDMTKTMAFLRTEETWWAIFPAIKTSAGVNIDPSPVDFSGHFPTATMRNDTKRDNAFGQITFTFEAKPAHRRHAKIKEAGEVVRFRGAPKPITSTPLIANALKQAKVLSQIRENADRALKELRNTLDTRIAIPYTIRSVIESSLATMYDYPNKSIILVLARNRRGGGRSSLVLVDTIDVTNFYLEIENMSVGILLDLKSYAVSKRFLEEEEDEDVDELPYDTLDDDDDDDDEEWETASR